MFNEKQLCRVDKWDLVYMIQKRSVNLIDPDVIFKITERHNFSLTCNLFRQI